MEKKEIRVAIYCRVATADQLSLEAQKEYLRGYAKEHGYDRIGYYMDNGYSGLNYDRPAFSRLEADIQAGRVGAVIVRNVDRIGRNVLETTHWIEQLRKKGVAFLTTDSSFNENSLQNLGCLLKNPKEYDRYGHKDHTGRRICRSAFRR